MGFQTAVNVFQALGLPGELAFDGPIRAKEFNLYSNGQAQIVGYAFTYSAGGNPEPSASAADAATAQVGGTGIFAGILMTPKEQSSGGASGNPLAATLTLPDYTLGSLLTMGEIFVAIPGPANPGDQVYYDNTSGALGTQAPTAAGVASQTTTVVTVTGSPTGNLGVGSVFNFGTSYDTATVIELGSGTGGAGTYNVSTSQSVPGSTAYTAGNSVAPSGKTLIARCEVDYFTAASVSPTGVAAIKLTN